MGLSFVGKVEGQFVGSSEAALGCVHDIMTKFVATIVTLTYSLGSIHH